MDEDEILAELESRGLVLDDGNLIQGPFIPDGTCRIYDPESGTIWGQGETPLEAWEDCTGKIGWDGQD